MVGNGAVRIGILPPWGLVDREFWGRVLPEREVGAWALVGESHGGPHPKKEKAG